MWRLFYSSYNQYAYICIYTSIHVYISVPTMSSPVLYRLIVIHYSTSKSPCPSISLIRLYAPSAASRSVWNMTAIPAQVKQFIVAGTWSPGFGKKETSSTAGRALISSTKVFLTLLSTPGVLLTMNSTCPYPRRVVGCVVYVVVCIV